MIQNCKMLLLAGYETTSTTLGFLCYDLACNPHVQTKLQCEIDQKFLNGVSIGNVFFCDVHLIGLSYHRSILQ